MPKKGTRKKEGRVTTTNIKVTTETHREIQVAATLTGMTQSELISKALRALLPTLSEEVNQLDAKQRETAERMKRLN